MSNKQQREAVARKKASVVARLNEMRDLGFENLVGMWDERSLDTLILVLGIGHVEIEQEWQR